MRLLLGRKCISIWGQGWFVPDWGSFRGGNAFLGEFVPDLGRFRGGNAFLWGSCSGSWHRAAGAAFRLSCGGCSERLAHLPAALPCSTFFRLILQPDSLPRTPPPAEMGPGRRRATPMRTRIGPAWHCSVRIG